MPDFEFTSPEGKTYTVSGPAGATREQAFQMLQSQLGQQSVPAESNGPLKFDRGAPTGGDSTTKRTLAGAALGVADLGNTALNALTYLPGKVSPAIAQWNRTRNADFEHLTEQNKDSTAFNVGRVGGNIAATLPAGGVVGGGVKSLAALPRLARVAPQLGKVGNAIASGGFKTGAPAATSLAGRAADLGIRSFGGAVNGGVTAGLVDPEDAGLGAMIGGALPGAAKVVGGIGGYLGRKISGVEVPEAIRNAAQQARAAGYVIPPTQARPTLANRAIEGLAGKLSTAQNASARNAPVTNELARKAIGATELTPAGLAQVRARANSAYDALGQSAPFQADDIFKSALDRAGATTSAMRQNFPELVNDEVDNLVAGLKSRGQFEAQPTIEAIKQFRFSGSTNKASLDPTKKALGSAQMKVAAALEDLIERNLQAAGAPELLNSFRSARQTLAKVYDVEKALNLASGNVDAKKLAQLAKKGRPLTGELKQIADFAAQFPKAAQAVEGMGSLPGVSPLDFAATMGISGATANPMFMAGVLARPAARRAALSNTVQNRLAKLPRRGPLPRLLLDERLQQLGYRAAPVGTTQ